MAESTHRSSLLLAAVVSAAVGAGTSFLWLRNVPPPGGPAMGGGAPPSFDAATENAALQARVKALQAEVAEARIQLAATRAFPGNNPAIRAGATLDSPDPDLLEGLTEGERGRFLSILEEMRARSRSAAEEAQAAFEEREIRSRLARDPSTGGLDPGKLDRLVNVLHDGGRRMRELRETDPPPGPEEIRTRIETIGRETRARLEEFLTKGEIDAVDAVLSPPEDGRREDR